MIKLCAPFSIILLLGSLVLARADSEPAPLEIESQSEVEYDMNTGIGSATNGVVVRSGETVLTAHEATINQKTGDIFAQGDVYVRKEDQTWKGEQLHYNFLTKELDGEFFRTGQAPYYAAGESLQGDITNHVYTATNVFLTADDYYQPLFKIRAKHLKLVPGKYFEATQATLYAGNVPMFYLPYYRRNLGERQNSFNVLPGFRSAYGPYALGTYKWFANENLDGEVHADYREKRGFGTGPDFHLDLGQYGDAILKYYYTYDQDPNRDNQGLSPTNFVDIPRNRERLYFAYEGSPATNLTLKSQIAFQSDSEIIHDFFESEYRKDIEPNTFFEANQQWRNWSLDALAQPRVNDFFETVERLPDVRLTGYRQEIGNTPLYYESESTVGWYQRLFAETNGVSLPSFSAGRADTFHQITMPENFFGWLNVTPRVGGRLTYYTDTSGLGATPEEQTRAVFNTGMEVSTKLSRTWPGLENHFFDMDGLRHIIEPSVNYVYVPAPNVRPDQLPQFDYESTNSFWMQPIEFPDFNSIDSIQHMDVIRWGLRNRLQTKRKDEIVDLLSWSVYMDWNLRPLSGESTFSDIFSEMVLRPRTWLTLTSRFRYDVNDGEFNLSQNVITLQPNDTWSWSLGHYYLRGGTIFGEGNNLFTSVFYYRFDENWGMRIAHNFDAGSGVMQEQLYTIYRDLRSWTAALTFRALDNQSRGSDYTIAATFSFKAFPHYHLNQDTVLPTTLVGY